jgi:hypothetical protein
MMSQIVNRTLGCLTLLLSTALLSGCIDWQLRKDTVEVSYSVGEIQQQQVLDNLAMFVCDNNAFPSFCYPNQGGSNVTDSGTAGVTPGFSRIGLTGTAVKAFVFSTLGMNIGAQRTILESYTLTPVNDPRKLELMRCAYQRAVKSCGCGSESTSCPDCQAIFNKFYTGDVNGDIRSHASGTVTSECLNDRPCWFHVGCHRCVPKHCDCVGHFRDTYVWVLPEGRDDLTKLTLAILDYAINNAPAGLSKQIMFYIDEYGLPTTRQNAVGQITANVAIDEQPASLLNRPTADELRIERILKDRLRQINEEVAAISQSFPDWKPFSETPGAPAEAAPEKPAPGAASDRKQLAFERFQNLLKERQAIESKLQYLGEQLRTPGLKQQFVPVPSLPNQGSPLLQFNMLNNTLTGQGM